MARNGCSNYGEYGERNSTIYGGGGYLDCNNAFLPLWRPAAIRQNKGDICPVIDRILVRQYENILSFFAFVLLVV